MDVGVAGGVGLAGPPQAIKIRHGIVMIADVIAEWPRAGCQLQLMSAG
jgi:hypothetical protein